MIYFPLLYIYSKLCLLVFKNTAWVPVILGKLHKPLDKMEVLIPSSSDSYEDLKSYADKNIYHSAWVIVDLLINNKPIHVLLCKRIR